MSKPLGSYVTFFGRDNLLSAIEDRYGSHLEKLSYKEKLILILSVATSLDTDCHTQTTRDEVYAIANKINEKLSIHEREGLLEAFASQLRWGWEDPRVTQNLENNGIKATT
jgi:hypothetical protein